MRASIDRIDPVHSSRRLDDEYPCARFWRVGPQAAVTSALVWRPVYLR